ncbi:MAG: EAL and HDOD domain-containing protein [Acidimicrobiales bacterium]
MAVIDVVVERQPVFDVELEVVGYELLIGRTGPRSSGEVGPAGDMTTASVLFDAVSIGVSRLVGDRLVFCDADRSVLAGQVPVVLPPELTVLEVAPWLTGDEEVVAGCRRLADAGFTIALDGVQDLASCEPLLGLANIVKVAHAGLDPARLAALLGEIKQLGALALALDVASSAQFEACREIGFDYFQGDLLSAPQVVPGRTLDASNLGRLRQAALLVSRQCSAAELEQVVRSEPAMAYQLMQIAGVGADNGFRRPVRSIREALVLLGWRHLQSWITFLLETRHGSTTDGEAITTLTRARMCELLAQRSCRDQADVAFAAGMLSAFDLLLDMPLDDVLAALPLDDVLRDAVARRDTPVGRIVADVIDCQLGRAAVATRAGFSEATLSATAISALRWAIEASSRAEPGDGSSGS